MPLHQKLIFVSIFLGISLVGILFFEKFFVLGQTQAVVSVVPPSQNVSVGQEVSISINISSAADLYAFQISLSYDSTILQYKNVSEGTFLNQGGNTTLQISPQVSGGSLFGYAVSRTGQTSGASGAGALAVFRFTALKAGTSNISIISDASNFKSTRLLSSSQAVINYSKNEGTVTVGGASSQPNITLVKQVDKTSAAAGEVLTYTINYQNSGSAEARDVVITDVLSAGIIYIADSATNSGTFSNSTVSWSLAVLAPGASGSLSFKATVE